MKSTIYMLIVVNNNKQMSFAPPKLKNFLSQSSSDSTYRNGFVQSVLRPYNYDSIGVLGICM